MRRHLGRKASLRGALTFYVEATKQSLSSIAILIFLSCAASQRPSPLISQSMPLNTILNLQLKNIAGPNLGENGSFGQPAGVAVDQIGEIFISDKAANAVYKFTPQLQTVAHEGGIGGSLGEFNRPQGMACDAALTMRCQLIYNHHLVIV